MKTCILAVLCFVLYGCEEETCCSCQTTYTTTCSDGRPAEESSITQEMCNYTQTEIEDYEEGMTYTTTITVGGVTSVVRAKTVCNK